MVETKLLVFTVLVLLIITALGGLPYIPYYPLLQMIKLRPTQIVSHYLCESWDFTLVLLLHLARPHEKWKTRG